VMEVRLGPHGSGGRAPDPHANPQPQPPVYGGIPGLRSRRSRRLHRQTRSVAGRPHRRFRPPAQCVPLRLRASLDPPPVFPENLSWMWIGIGLEPLPLMPPRTALLAAGAALSYLRSNNIVHRDLKPHVGLCHLAPDAAGPSRSCGCCRTSC
jgi:hypothetical protein